MSNTCANECNISCFYAGIQAVDSQAIKRYTFQGMEIFALIKSVNLSQPFLSSVCAQCGTNAAPGPISKITVDANQMLAIGYSHLESGFPIVLTLFPGVELIVRNGGKLAIFNDNSLVNYGCILLDNAALIMESDDHHARFINNGSVALKSSFLVGRGLVFNNGRINITCYSKFSLGKAKNERLESDEHSDFNGEAQVTNKKQLTTLDFSESYSRFINGGVLNIASYSTFDIEGSFINGKKGVACCFLDQLCCVTPQGTKPAPSESDGKEEEPLDVRVDVSGNSRFIFTFGQNTETEFINEVSCNLKFNRETTVLFQTLPNSNSKNTLSNQGIITVDGESTFKSVNVDNFGVFQSTYTKQVIDPKTGERTQLSGYNYAKCLFTCPPNQICRFSNTGTESFLVVAPTCTLFFDGYSVLNYGNINLGGSLSLSPQDPNANSQTAQVEDVATTLNDAQTDPGTLIQAACGDPKDAPGLTVSATLVFGYVRLNQNANRVTFKNFNNLTICVRSILMIGKNSLLDNANKPQVSMLNQGTIFNLGLLQVNRNSEIINRPCPFTMSNLGGNDEYSIVNGNLGQNSQSGSNAIILVRKPTNGNDTGGFIKSVSALLYNGGKIQNTAVGIIISWVGYEKEEEENFTRCNLVFGVQSRIVGTGKVRVLPYPNWSLWDQDCVNEYLLSQNTTNDLEFAF